MSHDSILAAGGKHPYYTTENPPTNFEKENNPLWIYMNKEHFLKMTYLPDVKSSLQYIVLIWLLYCLITRTFFNCSFHYKTGHTLQLKFSIKQCLLHFVVS